MTTYHLTHDALLPPHLGGVGGVFGSALEHQRDLGWLNGVVDGERGAKQRQPDGQGQYNYPNRQSERPEFQSRAGDVHLPQE